jgi:hypothetical protein
VVNGVCLAGGTAGCEFKSLHWQLFSMGLDWILSDLIDFSLRSRACERDVGGVNLAESQGVRNLMDRVV